MKRLFYLFLAIIILTLTACGQKEENDTQEKNNSVTTTASKEEKAQAESSINPEVKQDPGFTPFAEINDYIIDDQTFSPIYYEIEWEDDDPTTWNMLNIEHIKKGNDDTLYYFNTPEDSDSGLTYEVFTMDENSTIKVGSKIYSTINKENEKTTSIAGDESFVDGKLVMSSVFKNANENSSAQLKIETLDMKPILEGQQGDYETEIIVDKSFPYTESDDYSPDVGSIINTSEGPQYVYKENPDEEGTFKIISLEGDSANEQITLKDEYGLVDNTDDIVYIDLKEGNYFIYDDEALKRIEIKTGEPLYDGAEDKTLPVGEDLNSYDEFFRADENSFYAIDNDNELNTVYLFSTDLELIDTTSYFTSVDEEDDYEGDVYGPFNLDNNGFLVMDTFEYQRKEHMKVSEAKNVAN
ncbi:hypothetical protein SFC66_03755 [Terribacillus saccharophilus]|uniref:LptM family lipoprotein n=1 Tax=Terribacillus saccharophilus TaxID=361277 RepID=UPI003982C826